MKTSISLGLILLSLGACKKSEQRNSQQLQGIIADSCAQNPVNFLEDEEASGRKLYVFGSRDGEFRNQWRALQNRYRASGRDLSGAEKQAFAKEYLPRFTQNCRQFFAPAIEQCGPMAIGSSALSRCLLPYNHEFRKHLDQQLKTDEQGLLNLESLPE